MTPELVAGGGYGGLIREKPYCAAARVFVHGVSGDRRWSDAEDSKKTHRQRHAELKTVANGASGGGRARQV